MATSGAWRKNKDAVFQTPENLQEANLGVMHHQLALKLPVQQVYHTMRSYLSGLLISSPVF